MSHPPVVTTDTLQSLSVRMKMLEDAVRMTSHDLAIARADIHTLQNENRELREKIGTLQRPQYVVQDQEPAFRHESGVRANPFDVHNPPTFDNNAPTFNPTLTGGFGFGKKDFGPHVGFFN